MDNSNHKLTCIDQALNSIKELVFQTKDHRTYLRNNARKLYCEIARDANIDWNSYSYEALLDILAARLGFRDQYPETPWKRFMTDLNKKAMEIQKRYSELKKPSTEYDWMTIEDLSSSSWIHHSGVIHKSKTFTCHNKLLEDYKKWRYIKSFNRVTVHNILMLGIDFREFLPKENTSEKNQLKSFSEMYPAESHLNWLYIHESNLSGCNFLNVYFRGAILQKVTMKYSKISSKDSQGDLMSAIMGFCDLTGSEMPHCYARSTLFYKCNLEFCVFDHSNLNGITFINCQLKGASFSESTINGYFERCILEDVDFSEAHIEEATFFDCDLRGVKGLETKKIRIIDKH